MPITTDPRAYTPGDIVAWNLGGGITHIGIVVNQRGRSGSYMIVHNIGRGPQMEDALFDWEMIGLTATTGRTVDHWPCCS